MLFSKNNMGGGGGGWGGGGESETMQTGNVVNQDRSTQKGSKERLF